MKRNLLIGFSVGIVSLSCNKPRLCECAINSKIDGSNKTTTYVIRAAKHKAKSECAKYSIETTSEIALCSIK